MVPTSSRAGFEIRRLFRDRFGLSPVHIVRVPESVELLGNSAFLTEGVNLGMAINGDWELAASPRTDGKIELVSPEESQPSRWSISELAPHSPDSWTGICLSVLRQLARRGVPLRGFSAAMRSVRPWTPEIDPSALAVATAFLFRELVPFTLTETGCTVPPARDAQGKVAEPGTRERIELARLCRDAMAAATDEGEVHAPLVCLLAGEFEVLETDGQSWAVERIPLISDVAWVVCRSSGRGAWPAVWRSHGQEAARLLGIKTLRTVEVDRIRRAEKSLPDSVWRCACHAVEESRRVLFGARALRDGDMEQFGQYMWQSEEGRRALSEAWPGRDELNLLLDLAKVHPGCLGARACADGSTVNLVRREGADSFVQAMNKVYETRTGHTASARIVRPMTGAERI